MTDPDLTPVEWTVRGSWGLPCAIIRKLELGEGREAAIWYRVVTAARPEDRRLIGYCETLEAATKAARDWEHARSSWRHHYASRQQPLPPEPKPNELLRFWREQQAKES